jgi:hypothetical protein
VRKLLRLVEAETALPDELRVPARAEKRCRKPTREPLEQRVRAGVVAARRDGSGATTRIRSKATSMFPANVRSTASKSRLRSSHVRMSPPFRGFDDQEVAITRSRSPVAGRVLGG